MLDVRNLTSGYAGTTVLRDVSIEVPRGSVVALVGRNGMGKTTLIRTLMGYIRPIEGTIRFNDRDVGPLGPADRARAGIGYVPQGRQLFPDLTVEENLRMGEYVGRDKAERASMLDRVHAMFPIVRERRHQRGGTLSGGQQQMVAIGRALVGGPDLLLLDEPSEGIQPSIVEEIERHLVNLKNTEAITMLLVEQDCQFIKSVADRCYVLEHGVIKEVLEAEEFRETNRLEDCLAL
ncbi:MAG: ABC transporter ATP-binding protein [Azospirillaceae bacterium]